MKIGFVVALGVTRNKPILGSDFLLVVQEKAM